MKTGGIVVKGLGILLVVSVMLLLSVNQGYAFNQKKTNKIINSIEKKHKQTLDAARDFYTAVRRYEREKGGSINLVERWVNLGKASDPKKQREYWNKAFKQCKTGYKDIRKKHAKWEKKSKALWKELKKLDKELE